MHGLSSASTRRMAAKAAAKTESWLILDPNVAGPGLRDWLNGIGGQAPALAAAFDTRLTGIPSRSPATPATASADCSGGTATSSSRPPESFLVSQQNTVIEGEAPGRGAGVPRSA